MSDETQVKKTEEIGAQNQDRAFRVGKGKKGLLRMAILSGLAKGKIKPGNTIQVKIWKSTMRKQPPATEE